MNRTKSTPEHRALLNSTPGGILLREFLEPMGVSQAELCRRTGIPPSRLTEIIKGRRKVTAETAVALGAFFDMEPQFWLNLQNTYDLAVLRLGAERRIRARVRPLKLTA